MPEADRGRLDELLRALANPHRRRILELTWREERSAGELAELLDLAPASTSEHLKVLRKLGLVDARAEGTFRRYQARPAQLDRLVRLLRGVFPEEGR